ncbi:MAG: PEGA domain-containing protein [Acidobacteriia bacterium]|nr:PEGA domain-containing protein [Terriglobia bacterium]
MVKSAVPSVPGASQARLRLLMAAVAVLITVTMTVPMLARGHSFSFGFGYYGGPRHFYGHGYFYRPYGYPSFGFSYWGGGPYYDPYSYPYPYAYSGPGYGYPPPPPGYSMTYEDRPQSPNSRTAWLRIDVQPRDAAVYIDGEYAGLASDFEGGKRLLPVSPTDHTVRLEAQGFQSARIDLRVNPLQTLDVKQHLAPLAHSSTSPGEPPNSSPPPDDSRNTPPNLRQPYSGAPPRGRRTPPTYAEKQQPTDAAPQAEFGSIVLKFAPALGQATVYIDDRMIGTTEANDPVFEVNDVPVGTHSIRVTRDGYDEFNAEISVTPGQRAQRSVTLQKSPIT